MKLKEAKEIESKIEEIVEKIAPEANQKEMFGGLVFELKNKRLFCGVFIRKNYVSIEFDRGSELKDEQKYLEGVGKKRRHLILTSLGEIAEKKVCEFIQESYRITE